jgi:hypothetical protein
MAFLLNRLVAWIMIRVLHRKPAPPARLSLFIRDYVSPHSGVTVSAETQRKILFSQISHTTHGAGWNRPIRVTSALGVETLEYVRGNEHGALDRSEQWANQVRYVPPAPAPASKGKGK